MAIQAQEKTSPATKALFDRSWQFTQQVETITVDLPHDWDIYTASDPATGATCTGEGWFQGGKGECKPLKSPAAELVKLHFEGVYQHIEVDINGQKAGQHAYGYTPFTIDATPYLHKNNRLNEVLAKVEVSISNESGRDRNATLSLLFPSHPNNCS